MRLPKRFSIRAILLFTVVAALLLWLFLPLIRGDAYAEYHIVDLSVTSDNKIQVVADAKVTRNCRIGFSSPKSPVIGASPEQMFVFPGWPERRQFFYIGNLANGNPDIADFQISKGQTLRLDSRNPELIVFSNGNSELKLSFNRKP